MSVTHRFFTWFGWVSDASTPYLKKGGDSAPSVDLDGELITNCLEACFCGDFKNNLVGAISLIEEFDDLTGETSFDCFDVASVQSKLYCLAPTRAGDTRLITRTFASSVLQISLVFSNSKMKT